MREKKEEIRAGERERQREGEEEGANTAGWGRRYQS
jgi:hypothetical protein